MEMRTAEGLRVLDAERAPGQQPMGAAPKLQVKGVSLSFPQAGGGRVEVLQGVDLSLGEGEFCSIVGPSGCGKSTLLSVISGLIPPDAGSCELDGKPITLGNPAVGYMFQSDTLLPWATALENVRFPLDAVGRKDDGLCLSLLKKVGVGAFAQAYPWQLSGGMRKRVQLARLLAQQPKVLLMDEPFGALDAQTRLLMQEELLRLWDSTGLTVLFVTHDLSEAIALSDRVMLFTNRPGSIKEEYPVPIERPRAIETIVQHPAYNSLFVQVWQSLRKEITLE
ncbi:ABC transporter ATP-binding protein [Ramlibacter sp. AW1]|uniref:ABC transporter ATP-binding protein n=1 Tax=Ramlibacter aurantiacus TaxID=2801330 RepID=A0A937D1T1_9BURK|nr:ABC transporter ATP-binding protein [Ramlibacter aurantiacus]MBL0419090.1 ABC transporter ATP-binding protein [Ramlibacter aurantiacus]